jgi:hypothetical protein
MTTGRVPAQCDYLWLIGAVFTETGQTDALLSPQLNNDVINSLEQLSRTLAIDGHAVMNWAGASFHRAGRLKRQRILYLSNGRPILPS